jgi:hypothetical protein
MENLSAEVALEKMGSRESADWVLYDDKVGVRVWLGYWAVRREKVFWTKPACRGPEESPVLA